MQNTYRNTVMFFFFTCLLTEGQSKKWWWSCWNHTKLKACHTRHVVLFTSDWDRILVKQKLVQAVNNLVEKDELVAWSRMKEERREHTATKLLHVVEESALSLGNSFKSPAEIQIKATEMGEIRVFKWQQKVLFGLLSQVCFSSHLSPQS